MTTNMRDTATNIERAYELGRAAERQKMADLASLMSNESLANLTALVAPSTPMRGLASFSPIANVTIRKDKAPKPPKASAHGHKKAGAPRTKGVKKAIISLLEENPGMKAADVAAKTGFKLTSVAATMMSLKKAQGQPGNSDHTETHAEI